MKTAETRKEVEQLPRKNWLTEFVGANSSLYLSYAEGLIPLRPFTKEAFLDSVMQGRAAALYWINEFGEGL